MSRQSTDFIYSKVGFARPCAVCGATDHETSKTIGGIPLVMCPNYPRHLPPTFIQMPPIVEGQTHWGVSFCAPRDNRPTPKQRTAYERAMYRLLMWAHDKAEDLWHWLYAKSREFAPEPEGLRAGMWDNKPSLGWTGGMVSHNYKVVSVEDED